MATDIDPCGQIPGRDRGGYPQGRKDALDIAFVLRNAVGKWNRASLYDQHANLLEDADFDEDLAGALMLGQQVAEILSLPTWQRIMGLLQTQTGAKSHYPLVDDMNEMPEQFSRHLNLLEALYHGMNDYPPQQG